MVQEIVASLGGRYDQYRLRKAKREPLLWLTDVAQTYFDAGEHQEVLNQLRRGLKLQTPQLTMLEGWSLYRLGSIPDAEKSCMTRSKTVGSRVMLIQGLDIPP